VERRDSFLAEMQRDLGSKNYFAVCRIVDMMHKWLHSIIAINVLGIVAIYLESVFRRKYLTSLTYFISISTVQIRLLTIHEKNSYF
jgi:hypothetical protein